MKIGKLKKTAKTAQRNSLSEVQRAFAKAISNPLTKTQRSQKILRNGTSMLKLAEKFIEPNDQLTSFERLEIYNRQYWFRLIDCLCDDFPGLKALIGGDRFYALAEDYLIKFPSRSYTLRNLGSNLFEFLKKNRKYAGSRAGIALEMARFEWAQIEAFDGPGLEVMDLGQLNMHRPEKLKLHLQPYITLLELHYALDDFLLALRKEHAQRSEAGSERAPKKSGKLVALPKRQQVFLAVHRYRNSLYYKRLDKPSFVLLSELKKGVSLGQACEQAFKFFPKNKKNSVDAGTLIQQWFGTWSALNWFCVGSVR